FGETEVLDEAESICTGKDELIALNYLRTLYSKLSELGLGNKINIDLGLVHRNNYYTGVVFRGFIEGSGLTVLSGGRYDMLLGEFGKQQPATGFGVEVDALANAMLNRGEILSSSPIDVLVFGEDGYEMQALAHARELNAQEFVCENSVEDNKDEARSYAIKRGIKRLDIVDGKGVKTFEL
ncbi:MAG: ATP phosphoribosyltransferase regulatory subunit, partial [Eubacteriales bacterium]